MGYHGHAERLNQSRFLRMKIKTQKGVLVEKDFYRTADLTTKRANKLVIIGRLDRAVKVGGKYVALEHIEDSIMSSSNVDRVLVVSTKNSENLHDKFIAYVVAKENKNIKIRELHNLVVSKLDSGLLPQLWVIVPRESLQKYLNNNQKLDEKCLIRDLSLKKMTVNESDENLTPSKTSGFYPTTEPEQKIISAWKELLNLSDNHVVHLEQDFFELGGDSFIFIKMMGKLSKELPEFFSEEKKTISYDEFLYYPKLKKLIETLPSHKNYKNFIKCLKSGNDQKSPLFLIPSITGDGERDFTKLSRSEQYDRSIVTFTDNALNDSNYVCHSIEEYAAKYLAELQTVQNKGPYIIAGYSSGAAIAYEIACQLQGKSEEVSLLIIDGLSPLLLQKMTKEAHVKLLTSMVGRLLEILLISDIKVPPPSNEIIESELSTQVELVFDQVIKLITDEKSRNVLMYAKNLMLCQLKYTPKFYVKNIVFLQASNHDENQNLLGWCARTSVRLFGDHFDCLQWDENFKIISREIRKIDANDMLADIEVVCKKRYKMSDYTEIKIIGLEDGIEKSMPIKNCFVNLSLIDQNTEFNKNHDLKLYYSYENSHYHLSKEEINYKNLFHSRKIRSGEIAVPKKILITGIPGSGKTVLSKYFAHQGAVGKLWERFKVIIRFELRELNDEKIEIDSLSKLIEQKIRFEKSSILHKNPELLNDLISNSADKLLIILDGLDEFNFHPSNKCYKAINEIIEDRNIHLIVFSRPYDSDLKFDLVLENVGYTKEKIYEYVRVFHESLNSDRNETDLQIEMTYNKILQNSSLLNMARVPLLLNLICCLGKNVEEIDTVTELYGKIIEKLWHRWLEKKFEKSENILRWGKPQKDEHIKPLEVFFKRMSHITYINYKGNIFKINGKVKKICEQIELDFNLKDNLWQKALSTPFISKIKNSDEFEFIHYSFQEYFFAKCIVDEMEKSSSKEKTDIQDIYELMAEYKYEPRYQQNVLPFVAGLLQENKRLLKVFFDNLKQEPNDIIGNGDIYLFLRCIEESRMDWFGSKDEFIGCIRESIIYKILYVGAIDYIAYLKLCHRLINNHLFKKIVTDVLINGYESERKNAALLILNLWSNDHKIINDLESKKSDPRDWIKSEIENLLYTISYTKIIDQSNSQEILARKVQNIFQNNRFLQNRITFNVDEKLIEIAALIYKQSNSSIMSAYESLKKLLEHEKPEVRNETLKNLPLYFKFNEKIVNFLLEEDLVKHDNVVSLLMCISELQVSNPTVQRYLEKSLEKGTNVVYTALYCFKKLQIVNQTAIEKVNAILSGTGYNLDLQKISIEYLVTLNYREDWFVNKLVSCLDGYSRILVLNKELSQQDSLPVNTIALLPRNGNLVAYWASGKNGLDSKSLEINADSAIQSLIVLLNTLPKLQEVAVDKALIKSITSKYGCTNPFRQIAIESLMKLDYNTKTSRHVFWEAPPPTTTSSTPPMISTNVTVEDTENNYFREFITNLIEDKESSYHNHELLNNIPSAFIKAEKKFLLNKLERTDVADDVYKITILLRKIDNYSIDELNFLFGRFLNSNRKSFNNFEAILNQMTLNDQIILALMEKYHLRPDDKVKERYKGFLIEKLQVSGIDLIRKFIEDYRNDFNAFLPEFNFEFILKLLQYSIYRNTNWLSILINKIDLNFDWYYIKNNKLVFHHNENTYEVNLQDNDETAHIIENLKNECIKKLTENFLRHIIAKKFNSLSKRIIELGRNSESTHKINYQLPFEAAIYNRNLFVAKLLIDKVDNFLEKSKDRDHSPFILTIIEMTNSHEMKNLFTMILDRLKNKGIDENLLMKFKQGCELWKTGNYEEAIKYFESIISSGSNNIFLKSAELILSNILSCIGSHEKAYAINNKLYQNEESNIDFTCNLAWDAYRLDKLEEAKKLFEKARALPRRWFDSVLLNEIIMRIELGEFEEAGKLLASYEAKSNNKENFYIYTTYALLYGFQCQLDKAREYIEISRHINKCYTTIDSDSLYNESYILHIQAHLHSFNEDYQNALSHINKAIQLQPFNIGHRIVLINSLIEKNENHDDIDKHIKYVLKINSTNRDALISQAYFYFKSKRIKEAKNILDSLDGKSEIENKFYYYVKALIYVEEKDYIKAKIVLLKAQKFNKYDKKLLRVDHEISKAMTSVGNLLQFNPLYSTKQDEKSSEEDSDSDLYQTDPCIGGD